MNCPVCKHDKQSVVRTISWLEREVIRTRVCLKCQHSWTTIERPDDDQSCNERKMVVEEST